ncbi:MAG: hypothetical protein GEV08_07300 [Acidimicrobiia bacterium]|nr:hypothetical protein [Acidimicrobiia bacterium]
MAPTRVSDTRAGPGPLVAGAPGTVDFTDVVGIDSAHLTAVVLNVTVTGASTGGYLTVHPGGAPSPRRLEPNFTAGQTVPNAVVTGVDAAGRAALFNLLGSVHVIVDIVGWYDDGQPTDGLRFHELAPSRIVDTRSAGKGPLGAAGRHQWSRAAPVPAEAEAVALNVTVTEATGLGFLTVYPAGPLPGCRRGTPARGLTRANHALVPLGASDEVEASNSTGSAHLVYDVVGWFG